MIFFFKSNGKNNEFLQLDAHSICEIDCQFGFMKFKIFPKHSQLGCCASRFIIFFKEKTILYIFASTFMLACLLPTIHNKDQKWEISQFYALIRKFTQVCKALIWEDGKRAKRWSYSFLDYLKSGRIPDAVNLKDCLAQFL